jgi:hypothetical protein
MKTFPLVLGLVLAASACSEDVTLDNGANLEGRDGGDASSGSGGSAGGAAGSGGAAGTTASGGAAGTTGGGGSGGTIAGSAGAVGSSGEGGDSGSIGTGGSGGTGNAPDGGGACMWDGGSQRKTLDCIGDDYEYFGPGCRLTWHQCGPGDPGVVLPNVKFVVDCRMQNGSMVCDCLDQGKLVNTVSAPNNICWPQEAGVNQSPPLDQVYQPFLQLSASCKFCTYRPT